MSTPLRQKASIHLDERYPQDAYDGETLLKYADIAMYRAKRSTPGHHAFFSADDAPSLSI